MDASIRLVEREIPPAKTIIHSRDLSNEFYKSLERDAEEFAEQLERKRLAQAEPELLSPSIKAIYDEAQKYAHNPKVSPGEILFDNASCDICEKPIKRVRDGWNPNKSMILGVNFDTSTTFEPVDGNVLHVCDYTNPENVARQIAALKKELHDFMRRMHYQ